jgi:hypothetical protein
MVNCNVTFLDAVVQGTAAAAIRSLQKTLDKIFVKSGLTKSMSAKLDVKTKLECCIDARFCASCPCLQVYVIGDGSKSRDRWSHRETGVHALYQEHGKLLLDAEFTVVFSLLTFDVQIFVIAGQHATAWGGLGVHSVLQRSLGACASTLILSSTVSSAANEQYNASSFS